MNNPDESADSEFDSKAFDAFVAIQMKEIIQNSHSEKQDDGTSFEDIRKMYDFLLKDDFNTAEFEKIREQFRSSLITLTAHENLIETRQRINLRLTRLQANINGDINMKKINRLKYGFRKILIAAFPELIHKVHTPPSGMKKARVKPLIPPRTSRKAAHDYGRIAHIGSTMAKNNIDAGHSAITMDHDREIVRAAGGGQFVSILWGKVQQEKKTMREAAHSIAMRTRRENKSADDEFMNLTHEKFIGIVNGTTECTRGTFNTLLALARG